MINRLVNFITNHRMGASIIIIIIISQAIVYNVLHNELYYWLFKNGLLQHVRANSAPAVVLDVCTSITIIWKKEWHAK